MKTTTTMKGGYGNNSHRLRPCELKTGILSWLFSKWDVSCFMNKMLYVLIRRVSFKYSKHLISSNVWRYSSPQIKKSEINLHGETCIIHLPRVFYCWLLTLGGNCYLVIVLWTNIYKLFLSGMTPIEIAQNKYITQYFKIEFMCLILKEI